MMGSAMGTAGSLDFSNPVRENSADYKLRQGEGSANGSEDLK